MDIGNIMAPPAGTPLTAPISPAEWQVRIDLAIAYRLLDWLGMTDLIHTHISACVPGEAGHFLQLPYGLLFREARASSMVKCDVEGRTISDPTGLGISKGDFSIHSAIHIGNANAICVMHAHTEASLAVANYRQGLLPLSQHALRFYQKVAYLDYLRPVRYQSQAGRTLADPRRGRCPHASQPRPGGDRQNGQGMFFANVLSGKGMPDAGRHPVPVS